jgi:8-oxo-dGTP pyrophosphatase MutT (NUDIX family)
VPVIDRVSIAERVAAFPRIATDRPDLKQAAVAACLTIHDGVVCLVVTRRAARLRGHSGQWALPGGRREPDESAVEGALREMREEVGLDIGASAVLGLLDLSVKA